MHLRGQKAYKGLRALLFTTLKERVTMESPKQRRTL
nr:MAG TPA: hypothetical protein [Caudoviricetes sp.]